MLVVDIVTQTLLTILNSFIALPILLKYQFAVNGFSLKCVIL